VEEDAHFWLRRRDAAKYLLRPPGLLDHPETSVKGVVKVVPGRVASLSRDGSKGFESSRPGRRCELRGGSRTERPRRAGDHAVVQVILGR